MRKTTTVMMLAAAVLAVAGCGDPDPKFDSCSAAKDAGYGGPYERGKDTEYGWYSDSDGDGLACE